MVEQARTSTAAASDSEEQLDAASKHCYISKNHLAAALRIGEWSFQEWIEEPLSHQLSR